MGEPYLKLPVGELLDAVAKRGGPGAGAIAGLQAAAAAALVELAARATDAEAYEAAIAQLRERGDDFALGEALARAADVPLEIADHAENVAALAADAASNAHPEVRADA